MPRKTVPPKKKAAAKDPAPVPANACHCPPNRADLAPVSRVADPETGTTTTARCRLCGGHKTTHAPPPEADTVATR